MSLGGKETKSKSEISDLRIEMGKVEAGPHPNPLPEEKGRRANLKSQI